MDGMDRLNTDSLDYERMQGLRHYEPVWRDLDVTQLFQAGAGQYKRTFSCPNQLAYGLRIAMIAVVMGDEQDIEIRCDFRSGNRRQLNLIVVVQGKISADQETTRLY